MLPTVRLQLTVQVINQYVHLLGIISFREFIVICHIRHTSKCQMSSFAVTHNRCVASIILKHTVFQLRRTEPVIKARVDNS